MQRNFEVPSLQLPGLSELPFPGLSDFAAQSAATSGGRADDAPPSPPDDLAELDGFGTCDVVGPLAAVNLVAVGLLMCLMVRRPIARTAEFSLLVGAQLVGALVQADYLYIWLASGGVTEAYARAHPMEEWLRLFSGLGVTLYFLAMSIQLLRTVRSPFQVGSNAAYHILACSVAAGFAALAVQFELSDEALLDVPPGDAARWALTIVRSALYILALATLLYAWRLILRGVQAADAAYTQKRRILTVALATILLIEAVFGIFPPLVPLVLIDGFHLDGHSAACTATILLGLQDAVLAASWLLVLQYSAHKLREAAQGDRRSISLETKGSFEPEGAGDLSAALRKQLVSLITEGACRSAWEVERESEEGLVSSLTPPECTTEQDKVELAEEYRSVSTLSRFGTSQDVRGSRQTPVHVSTFAPRIFHELRRFGGVSTREYTHSLGGEATERFTEGKSGAFFYFTHDRRYIIKTASKEEFATLMRILPRYHTHAKRHPHSLINRIVGAHELSLYGQRVRVMVVESCFQASREVHERYDLKGSWVGRGGKMLKSRGDVLKDLDVRSRFLLAEEDARRISRHLREDAAFLKANNLIDYSLLVGVTKTRYEIEGAAQRRDTAVVGSGPGDGAASAPFHRLDSGGLAAAYVEGAELYSMGIIDILQDFNLRKRAEYLIKRFVCCQGKGVSVHPAGEYGDRFVRNVVEALIEPVRLGAEPRVIRGYTPAGSPLGMFDLKQSERRVALGRNRTRAAPVVPHPQQPQPFGAERSGVWAPPRTSPRLVAAELGRHTDGSSGGLPTTEPPRAFTFPRDGVQEREHAKPASGQQHQERGADCSPSDERRCELM